MKREYSYVPIILILIINAAIIGMLANMDIDTTYIQAIIGTISNFMICSALLHTRRGGVAEYFSNIKRFNIRALLVNIIASLGSFLFLFIFTTLSAGGVILTKKGATPGSIIGMVIALGIATIIVSLLLNYTNFVLVDERYKDYSFGKIFKLIIKTGYNLTFESIKVWAKFYIIPAIIVLINIVLIVMGEENQMVSFGILLIVAMFISFIYLFFITPVYLARLSDVYIDNTGYDIFKDYNNDNMKENSQDDINNIEKFDE